MVPMLLLAVLAAAVSALLWLRSRQARWGTGRLDRRVAVVLVVMSVAVGSGSVIAPVRSMVGFGELAQCRGKPHAELRDTSGPVDDELFKAEVRQRRLEVSHPPSPLRASGTVEVARLTGPDSVNGTDDRWNVFGTDLGHVFAFGDRYGLVFGDTFGDADRNGWRSNVLAWAERPARDQLLFTDMLGSESGQALELLGSLKLRGWEQTVIPTYAIAAGDGIVVHYMSVVCWGLAGRWAVDHAGLAVSEDGGRSFQRVDQARWDGAGGFAQMAFVRRGQQVFAFGVPAGRDGPARLARVHEDQILDPGAWEYWDGAAWVPDVTRAVPIVTAPVGELSVQWNEHHRVWVMMYLHEQRGGIVLRTADRLTGPWSTAHLVASVIDFPTLYAPYQLPEVETAGDTYFTMSRFDVYNVLLMRTWLERVVEDRPEEQI